MLCNNAWVKNVVEGWLLKTTQNDNEPLTMGPFNTPSNMKMCSSLKFLDFVWQLFYFSLRGDAFDAFLHGFFFGVKFCF